MRYDSDETKNVRNKIMMELSAQPKNKFDENTSEERPLKYQTRHIRVLKPLVLVVLLLEESFRSNISPFDLD